MGVIIILAGDYGNGKFPGSTIDEFYMFRVREYTIIYEILYIFSSTITKCAIAFTQVFPHASLRGLVSRFLSFYVYMSPVTNRSSTYLVEKSPKPIFQHSEL